MKTKHKTFFAGLISIVIGTSCCWLTTIVIWVGGAGTVAYLIKHVEKIQTPMLILGAVLLFIAAYKYSGKSKK